jgi:hypothetical protein
VIDPTSFWCSKCKKDHPGECPPEQPPAKAKTKITSINASAPISWPTQHSYNAAGSGIPTSPPVVKLPPVGCDLVDDVALFQLVVDADTMVAGEIMRGERLYVDPSSFGPGLVRFQTSSGLNFYTSDPAILSQYMTVALSNAIAGGNVGQVGTP